ncbi:MAG TPA: ABC transporter substrate-binding protein [Stellaceae bacterium]|nr:ABC transporter substrate-binding protein [Stellaceae bacterium]
MRGLYLNRRQVIGGTAGLWVAAALAPRAAEAQGTSVLRVRSYGDIQDFDPAFSKAAPDGDVARSVFRQLITYKSGASWEWTLDAAAEIKQVDPKTVSFTLKPGIKWSGGFGEMTADDVKYSFERIANPATKSPYKGDWATLDQVEVTGPLSGVIHLKEPFAPLWLSTLPWNAGIILCKKAMEASNNRFTTNPPAMCGAYLLKEWRPKQETILVRNPDYTGPRPAYDEIHIRPIEDEKTAEIGFEAKELDFTGTSVSSLPKLKSNPPAGSKVGVYPSLAYVWLGMNVDVPPFNDIKLRKAVQKAVDVDAILQAAYFGAADRATGIIAPGLLGHRDLKMPRRDLEGAKKLMAESGKSGVKATLAILNKTERLSAAQVIQANLAEIGIEVQIDAHDSGTFWSLGDQSKGDQWKQLHMVLQRYTMAPDPSWAVAWFLPSQIGVWNWERWNSPEFDELNKKALVETDNKKRGEMYVRMQDLMEESGAYVFITHEVAGVMYLDSVAPAPMPDGRVILPGFAPKA